VTSAGIAPLLLVTVSCVPEGFVFGALGMANARLTGGMAGRRTGGWDAVLAALVSGLVLRRALYLDLVASGRDGCGVAA
jgi:hypothetical protein